MVFSRLNSFVSGSFEYRRFILFFIFVVINSFSVFILVEFFYIEVCILSYVMMKLRDVSEFRGNILIRVGN